MFEPIALSPAQAAAYVGLSVRSIYRLLEGGTITGRRKGARTLVDGNSLRTYYAGLPEYESRPMPNAAHVIAPDRRKRRARP
jgi:excisionase family DNA binding protein